MNRSRGWAALAAGMGTVLATVVVAAPARWAGAWLESRGTLALAGCDGTVWDGSGLVAVADEDRWVVLPGRLSWTLQWGRLVTGRLELSLTHPALENPVRVTLAGGRTEITESAARLPAALLVAAGVPFNTLRPEGELRVRWSALSIAGADVTGHAELTWTDARSALSPVAPLGSFRLTGDARGKTGGLELRTLQGPLLLEGRGTLDERRLRFKGTAASAPETRENLASLLGVLGRRMEDKVLLEWELQR